MSSLFPTYRYSPETTLYIIGNGFDLYHGIPSRYTDFRYWLSQNQQMKVVVELGTYFPTIIDNQLLLWADFERALGEYNQIEIAKTLSQGYDRMMDDSVQFLGTEWFRPLILQIPILIKNWARSINICNVAKILPLHSESLYITFNYTKILENIYNIPYNNIYHIHGSIDSKVVVGHRTFRRNTNEVDDAFLLERVRADIIDTMNTFDKNRLRYFDEHKELIRRLHSIKDVFVLGHSLSEIDCPYFGSICQMIASDAQWHFSVHSSKDRKSIYELMRYFRTFHTDVVYTCFSL